MTSRTMSVSIKRDPKTVYEFVFNLENLPKWANAAFQSIREQDGEWIVGTPRISKVLHKEMVLDHYVILQSGMEVFVQLRVIPQGMPPKFDTMSSDFKTTVPSK